jgi:hypothetical protein
MRADINFYWRERAHGGGPCVRLSTAAHTRAHKHFIAQLGARNSLFRTRNFYSVNAAGGDVRGRNKQDIFNAQVTTYFYGPGRS